MSLVNGRETPSLGIKDRGLLYGDGLFETIAVLNGTPLELERHLKRLRAGCERLGIAAPDANLLKQEVMQVCARTARAVLKIIITRGQGGRGYRPAGQGEPTRIVMTDPWPEYPRAYYTQGIDVRFCQLRLARNPQLAGIKHLNRLEQVLARGEWQDDYQEGLLLDSEGLVIEGTTSNVFIVRDHELHTPALEQAGVAGIMRARILEAAAELGISAHVRALRVSDIEAAEAMFFCNSLIGVWPARRCGDRRLGDHPLLRELIDRFHPQ